MTNETGFIVLRHVNNELTNKYLIEGVAADGWVRGGIPSREMSREKAYASCNYGNSGQ